MFIVSAKLTPAKLIAASAVLLTAVFCIIWAVTSPSAVDANKTVGEELLIEDEEDVREFLQSYGWSSSLSGSQESIRIPAVFNETFTRYNSIQKLQGFDLEAYKGKYVTRYTYEITNYPDNTETIYANVLVYNGTVVGGDICTSRADGYMHGFTLPEELPFDTTPASEGAVTEFESSSEDDIVPEK